MSKSIFIIGPSGSGKSTLCHYLVEIYRSLFGSASVLKINLDPANNSQTSQNPHVNAQSIQKYNIDISELITLEDIMEEFQLGPNGALQYAMDFLYENRLWLQEKIHSAVISSNPAYSKVYDSISKNPKQPLPQNLPPMFIFYDLPGQIELYLANDSTKKLIEFITFKQHTNHECLLLELFDSTYIYKVNDFISLCMTSLTTMLNFEKMVHFALLTKIDVLKDQRPALGMLNDYLQVYSAKAILQDLVDEQSEEGTTSTAGNIATVIDQFGQVSFLPCSIHKLELIKYLVLEMQRAFNAHELHKINNPRYTQFVKDVDFSMAKDQIISSLENQLFEEDQDEKEEREVNQVKLAQDIKKERMY